MYRPRDNFSIIISFRGAIFIAALLLFSSLCGVISSSKSSLSEIGSVPIISIPVTAIDSQRPIPLKYMSDPRSQEDYILEINSELRICPQLGDTSDQTRRSGSSSRGETREFIVSGGNTITAELKKTGENCYLYVEEGYLFFPEELVEEFDERIFPELSTIMGTPGDIDGDARIYILYYNMGNNGIAGYFHPNDPNGLDLLYLNLYYDPGKMVISHELTHQIQNNYDKAEERWIDEGLAEIAKMHLYGEPRTNSFMKYFENLNSISLNWKSYSNYPYINWAQYGIAYVFQQYIYDQFEGLDSSGLILRDGFSFDPGSDEKYQGIDGINNFFNLSGSMEKFNSFFRNWTVANLLNNDEIGAGTWGYDSMDISIQPTLLVENATLNENREINAYAPFYVQMNRTARPTEVMITAGDDMSLAIIGKGNESSGADNVEIIELAVGENEFVIDTTDPRWKHITLDIINHKDADEIISIRLSEIPFKPPVAIAGENVTLIQGEEIIFNATASYHPEGIEIIAYHWDFQDDGIFDSEGSVVSYTYHEPGDYTAVLKIVDKVGNEAMDSLELTVLRINNPPEIDVWLSEQQPLIFENVTIDARNCSDPDGDPIDFTWTMGDNGNTDSFGSSFRVFFSIPGRNYVILNVSDGRGMSAVKEIVLYVRENSLPVAVAPEDLVVNQNESFVLQDGGSFDIDDHFLSYEWSDGERTKYGKKVSWEFPSRGRFPITLLVRDELSGTDKDLFYVRVNGAPKVNVDYPQEIEVLERVVFDAGRTRDPEGDRLEYSWVVGTTELVGEKGNKLEYVFREAGTKLVTITVSDSYGARSTQMYDILVKPQVELKKINIKIPNNLEVFTDEIEIKGDHGGNKELDAVYILVDNGRLRGAVDRSVTGDWSSWDYKLDVRKMALGPHTIKIFGTLKDRATPDAVITVYLEEPEEKRVPNRYADDYSSVDNDEIIIENTKSNFLLYAIPVGAFIFSFLIVGILLKGRSDHRKEMKRLLEELLL